MPNIRTKKIGEHLRFLFVGDPGNGKTVAAASFPGPMIIYDFDDNVSPVIPFYPHRDDIEYKVVVSTKSERKDTVTFIEFCKEFMDYQDRCPYETVVIDSLTTMSACCVLYALDLNGEFNLKKGKLPRPQFDEYKGETATMLKILEVAKSLSCNIVATAHPVRKLEVTTPGDLESLRTVYSLTGYGTKTPSFIPVYFNEMYYFYSQLSSLQGQKPKRFITTVPNNDNPAKTTLPLPPVIEITDKPLYNVIQRYLKDYSDKLEKAG